MDYKTSGVDVQAGRAFIDRIKTNVEKTHRAEVIGGLGGFGGLCRLPLGMKNPVLVSGTDGVGTKLELAQQYHSHLSVGVDLVAMCVNDVITSGADPLFFLDYIASGRLNQEAMAQVVEGIANGCMDCGCALLGGETAEMPGFYPSGRYDLAGFCVGVVEEESLITGQSVKDGDQIIGIESSGIHSNGFSLVREVLGMQESPEKISFGPKNLSLIDLLLKPTKLYAQLVKNLLIGKIPIHGMAHITGGGLPENLPRCLPQGLKAHLDISTWQRPEIYTWLKEAGDIPEPDLWNTFNLGIGFCLVVPPRVVGDAIDICKDSNLDAWNIGQVGSLARSQKMSITGLPF